MPEVRSIGYTVNEIRDAAPDYLAQRLGIRNPGMHPTAEEFAGKHVTLSEMALVFGERAAARRQIRMTRPQAISAGLVSDDFGEALTDSIRRLVEVVYDTESDHRRIAKPVPVRNFNEVSFPTFDLDVVLPEILENAEFQSRFSMEASGGESAALKTFGALIGIGRKTLINDDLELIESVFRQLAATAARLEAVKVYGVLETNPTLADGSALFTGDNLLSSTVFSKAALGTAFAALRRQQSLAGAETNNRPAFLVVPPEKEVEALSVVTELSNSGRVVQVIATPWIAATNWYLLADPARAPVVGLLRLEGAERAVDARRGRRSIGSDSLPIKTVIDVGVTALSRVGAIRGQDGA